MLTDILAHRYLDHPIWSAYTELEQRLLNQAFGVVKEALPYYNSEGKVIEARKATWKTLHDRIARELGVKELAQRYYSYTQKNSLGQDWPVQGWFEWDYACEQFVTAKFPSGHDPDRFMKERLSFIELAMRFRNEEVAHLNASLPQALMEAAVRDRTPTRGIRVPGSAVDGARAWNATINATFNAQVNELNERFRRARAPLTYHNGFIQVSLDEKIEQNIAKPFWDLVADPIWKNVDIDMKEALDRRDSNDKDPAIFAAKALESAIKIVSELNGWTRGTETGASNYVDNLVSRANGGLLAVWEGEMLKDYFRKVRNSLGHGPGSEPMPTLNLPQTDWAIETAMSWVRTLVRRM
ncbi:MAG: AbiJ-NTD4 domain-containing protein [Burkholderiaceae bacterium]